MKKTLAILTLFVLLCALPFSAAADFEKTLELTPPDKMFYQVGETPDYTGGLAIYNYDNVYRFELSDENCTGLDTSTPGNKTVTFRHDGLEEHFRVIVLSNEEPILNMKDIDPEAWYIDSFGPCMKAGYFSGSDTGMLYPTRAITRAEMATIIYQAWKNDPEVMAKDPNAAAPFKDMKRGSWYYEAVEACRKAGLIFGTDTGEFKPNAAIRRQDAVLMLMRIQYTAEELAGLDADQLLAESGIEAKDFAETSDYAKNAMAASLGTLVFGNGSGYIKPLSEVSRAECASILNNLFLVDYEWVRPDFPKPDTTLIYLSPSRQFTNPYAGVNTNEGEQMYRLAEALKPKLEAAGYEVVIARREYTIHDRPPEAEALGADLYIPIHSNAGGGKGTRIFYNGAINGSYELSRAIFDPLAKLTNTPLNDTNLKEDYVCLLPDGSPFHELAAPTMPVAYLEVEFHDQAKLAQWIIKNTDAIATAIATGVINYCNTYLQ